MLVAKTFEEAERDVMNPNQVPRTFYSYNYASPSGSGWQQVFYNRVGDAGSLGRLGRALGNPFATLPAPVQIGIVGVASAAAGYFLMAKFGDKYIKPALRKVGIGRR